MHFTIFSRRIPPLTHAQFHHEFSVVHAEQTLSIAQNLGIIHEYEQGLALPILEQPGLERTALFPLQEAADYDAFARLTWPSVEVMQGSFTTEGYRESAGKHIFAQPFQIFLTEPLGTNGARQALKNSRNEEGQTFRVIMPIQPRSANEVDFEERWNEHADFIRSIVSGYTLHRSLNILHDRLKQIFDQTQFDHRLVVAQGGYEEFVFGSRGEAESFFGRHGKEIRDSYSHFVDPAQFKVFIFDSVTKFAVEQRGLWQIGMGLVVGTALRLKILLSA